MAIPLSTIPATAALPFDVSDAAQTLATPSQVEVGRRRFMIGSASAAGGLIPRWGRAP